MYLRTLTVNGFKSFVETKLDFPTGITAVVGPNGTGKSNIVDSILWAMGEQSVKSLRSERMEDVIFNGTEQRKPLGMVEASLVFTGVSPRELEPISAVLEDLGQPTEVMITRRLYRDGESEYYLNKIPCRLKDIRGFLWNVRAGTRGQSVIEQGNIEQLLNASPQERREFIEGTAGIIRYKKQKAEALRKLEGTEHNLLRVRDILGEVRQQLKTLTRQAKQAEEYRSLQKEARNLEVKILTWDFQKYVHESARLETELRESENQELTCLAQESCRLAEREEYQWALSVTNESLAAAQGQLQDLERQMAQTYTAIQVERHRLEELGRQHEQVLEERGRLTQESQTAKDTLEMTRERMSQIRCEMEISASAVQEAEEQLAALAVRRKEAIEQTERGRGRILELAVEQTNLDNRLQGAVTGQHAVQRRLERLSSELAQSQTDQAKIQAESETFQQQRIHLEGKLESLRKEQEQWEVSLQSHRESREEMDERLHELQTQLAGTDSELRALQGIFREELGYGSGEEGGDASVRGICSGIESVVAEGIDVSEKWEKAIEAALGRQLRAWVVRSPQVAQEAVEAFKHHHLGRGIFIPLNIYHDRETVVPSWWEVLQHDPRVKGMAVSVVQVVESLRQPVEGLLGKTVLVESLQDAMVLMAENHWFNGEGPLLATVAGELVSSSGLIVGGEEVEGGGVLHRKREISTLERRLHLLLEEIDDLQGKRKTIGVEIETVSGKLEEAVRLIRETEIQWLTVKKEGSSREQALPELFRRVEVLSQEQELEGRECERLQQEEGECRQRLAVLEETRSREEAALRTCLGALEDLERKYGQIMEGVNETRVTHQTLKTQWDHEHGQIERIEREEDNRKARLQHIDRQLEQLFLQSRKSQDDRLNNEELIESFQEKKEVLSQDVRERHNHQSEITERMRQCDKSVDQGRDTLSKIFKARVPIESHLAEVRTKLHGIKETLQFTYDLQPDDLILKQTEGTSSEGTEESPSLEPTRHQEDWREQLQHIRRRLERIGPINLAAIEEHQQLEERYQFLLSQEGDLANSIQSLQEIIHRLNQTTNRLFEETFQELQVKFGEVFSALFAGGRAELVMVEEAVDGADGEKTHLEPGVEIVAQPPGKRLKNLSMLSGGEKTLTVMALLFASFLIRPSPFCVLDEVDAPLDENNVVRFGQFLRQMADRSQFIVITHNKRTMEIADSLFGVTMEEAGVSKLVSVRLHDLQEVG